jgi:hypothetical protein
MPFAALDSRFVSTLAWLLLAVSVTVEASGCGASGRASGGPRTFEFSGYRWEVKAFDHPVGPGPNTFSDSADNVWVDSSGRLHLKITRANGRWYSAEVVTTRSFGHGRYSFELDSPVSDFDPNVVLALFTWSYEPEHHHREIDIEFSRWAHAAAVENGQYVVQPYSLRGHRRRFTQPPVRRSTQSFDWRPNAVTFTSSSAVPSTWTISPAVPPPGSEQVRINLWLYRGAAPTNGRSAEVVITRFEFTPPR